MALKSGKWVVLLALVFPLIGVALLSHAAYQTMRKMKFGRSILELDTIPGIPGRKASFTLRTRMAEVPEAGFAATLRHVHRISTGSGSRRSTREEVQWEQLTTVPRGAIAPSSDTLRIPIHFTLPEDAHETDPTDDNFVHLWRLDVSAVLPGVDYASRFEVPVFHPPQ